MRSSINRRQSTIGLVGKVTWKMIDAIQNDFSAQVDFALLDECLDGCSMISLSL